jgi:hypothetical protein
LFAQHINKEKKQNAMFWGNPHKEKLMNSTQKYNTIPHISFEKIVIKFNYTDVKNMNLYCLQFFIFFL